MNDFAITGIEAADAAEVREALLVAARDEVHRAGCRALFEDGTPLPSATVADWLPLGAASRLGLVEVVRGASGAPAGAAVSVTAGDTVHATVRPLLRVVPMAWLDGSPGFVVSDLRPAGPLPADHVMGAAGASRSLATLVPRGPVGRALDLGCGSGVQSLLLAGHAEHVTASDPNARALRCTWLTAALSGGPTPQLVRGSLAEPFADGAFDLVVSNPPFVIGPDARRTYRDSPFPADGLTAALVPEALRVVRPGGLVVLLTSWLAVAGEPWQDRVGAWLPPGCQAWVARREALPPADYVDLWLADANDPPSAREPWLAHLRDLGAEAVCFGWIVLQRQVARGDPQVWCEDVLGAPRLPEGAEVLGELARQQALPAAAEVLAGRPIAAGGAVAEVFAPIDAAAAGLASAHGDAAPAAVDRAAPRMFARPAGWRAAEPLPPPLAWWFAEPVPSGPLVSHVHSCCEETATDADEVLVSWLSGVRDLIAKGFATLEGSEHVRAE